MISTQYVLRDPIPHAAHHPPALAAEDRADGPGFVPAALLALVLSTGLWGLIGLGAWHLLG